MAFPFPWGERIRVRGRRVFFWLDTSQLCCGVIHLIDRTFNLDGKNTSLNLSSKPSCRTFSEHLTFLFHFGKFDLRVDVKEGNYEEV